MSENIFANEWIECLEAHYVHVIRTKDHVTEPSLTIVMHSAGFSDKQLAELRVRATMHVDDVGADFVPDLHILDGHNHDHSTPDAHIHDHISEPVSEPQIFNIPIDLPSANGSESVLEAIPAIEPDPEMVILSAELETAVEMQDVQVDVMDDGPQAELESELIMMDSEFVAELPQEELDMEVEVPEAELDVVDDEAPVEPVAEEPDPDAPQQLSLF